MSVGPSGVVSTLAIQRHIGRFLTWPLRKLFEALPSHKEYERKAKEEKREREQWYETLYVNNFPLEEREAAKERFAKLSFEEKEKAVGIIPCFNPVIR